ISLAGLLGGDEAARCGAGAEGMARVWNPSRAAAIRAAFAATGKASAGSVSLRIEAILDAYARAWTHEHREVCRATRVLGHQSEALMDERVQCLREQLQRLDATVDLYARSAPQVLKKAVDAAYAIPSPARCAAAVVLRSRVPPPDSSAQRERVLALRAEMA